MACGVVSPTVQSHKKKRKNGETPQAVKRKSHKKKVSNKDEGDFWVLDEERDEMVPADIEAFHSK